MKSIFLSIVGIFAALLLASVVTGAAQGWNDRYDPVEAARQDAQIAQLARERERAEALAPFVTLAQGVLVVGVPVVLLGVLGVALLTFFRSADTVMPRGDGLLPVRRADLAVVAPQALGAFHAARQLEAARQPVPHTLSYAPRADYRADAGRAVVAPADQLPAAQLPPVPTFRQLLDGGRLAPGQPMLLGYDRTTGEPVNGSWLDLYSTAVGGLSGTGKSWTATFLACQAALHGSRLLILDPHAESPESLAARLAPMRGQFICAPATTPAEMLTAVKLAAGELARRKAGGYTRGTAPIVVVADEFAALQRGELADPLAALIEALGQEGRKLDLYGMVCSQVWSAERAGGTPLRDSLASAYIHRLRPAQARMLSGLTSADLPDDLFSLPQGTAYLVTTGGELRPVVIPQMAPEDVQRVAELLGGATSTPTSTPTSTRRPVGFTVPAREVGMEVALEAADRAPLPRHQNAANAWTAEEARIVALLALGKRPREVVREVYGVTGGRGYTAAAAKVAAVIARLATSGNGGPR